MEYVQENRGFTNIGNSFGFVCRVSNSSYTLNELILIASLLRRL